MARNMYGSTFNLKMMIIGQQDNVYEVAFHHCPLQWMMDGEEQIYQNEIFTRVIIKKFREVHARLKYKSVFTFEFGNEMLEYLHGKERIHCHYRLGVTDQEYLTD